MFLYILKVVLSALIIVVISEVSKRSTLMGSVLATLPVVSVIAMIWLYIENQNTQQIIQLSKNIFWLVLPTLSFFLVLPILLEKKIEFFPALTLSCSVLFIVYLVMILVLQKMGVKV